MITFEFENVPAPAIAILERLGAPVAPGARALAIAQDRLAEKPFLNDAGAPTVAFAQIDGRSRHRRGAGTAGRAAAAEDPARRLRRQGPGLGRAAAARRARRFAAIGARPAIAEAPADFRRELSVIAARGRDGEIALYPLAENHHEDGILRRTVAPAQAHGGDPGARPSGSPRTLLSALDYVGVIGIELFERDDGRLLVNEFAPRVHNTGHWTLDGCEVDQFEQHIRAIAGWPLGPDRTPSPGWR